MQLRTTSTQRTYRYVRVALVTVIVFLGVGVAAQISAEGPLVSVSASYYTPARNVFVGALCAVSLALLALSGRSLEQALLDVAALLAPVIALVPTPVEPGDVPALHPDCPGSVPCIPADVLPEIGNGMLSLAVMAGFGVVASLVLAAVQRTLTPGLGGAIAVATAVVAAGTAWWVVAPDAFALGAHAAATIGFFALVTAVAAIAAVRPVAASDRRRRSLRRMYAAIATGIGLALLFLAIVVGLRGAGLDLVDASGAPLIFIGEAVALVLFGAFWAVQTVELWDAADPRVRADTRGARE